MARQIADEEDGLRRQARRRLIGAVALATAVVVLLPMVLDNEPRPSGQDIDLRIPDKDKAGEFAPKMVPVPASAPAASAVAAVFPVPPVPQSAPVSAVAAASAPAEKDKAAHEPARPAKPEAAPDKAASQPEPDAEAPQLKPATQLSSTKPKPGPDKHADKPASASSFVIQFGAFSNADAANRLQQKLTGQGIKAYTEKAGDKLRVRAGPYATREAAEKARRKLEAQGVQAVVSPAR